MASSQRDRDSAPRHGIPDNEHGHSHHQHQDLDHDSAWTDRTPSYSDIHETANGAAVHVSCPPPPALPPAVLHRGLPPPPPPAAAGQSRPAQTLTQTKPPHLLPLPAPVLTPSGLCARLELETDTVEIYDRSNDSFQYSLKGTIELEWMGQTELILKDARIDFMGYAVGEPFLCLDQTSFWPSLRDGTILHPPSMCPCALSLTDTFASCILSWTLHMLIG